jgi:malate-CoA ligase subunit beta
MDIHEYQAKEILATFGIPIPRGGLAYSPEQAMYRAREVGGEAWVVKAQIHSGARGKAGGIRFCRTDREISAASDDLLGKTLVTNQTGPRGKTVYRLYVEEATEIEQEIYLGLVLDRKSERVMVVASAAGGMEIEEISEKEPDSIVRCSVDPAVGLREFQARELAFGLGLDSALIGQMTDILTGAFRAFGELDATLVEINPLVITKDNRLVALDVKMSFDDNALFRLPKSPSCATRARRTRGRSYAADRGLSYVGLDGNIGCIINGAGLAMATMDMIKLAGGEPANFLDIGGGASPERVSRPSARSCRREGRGDAGQHLRRHQPLRLGRRGRGPGGREIGLECPSSCALPAPMSRKASDILAKSGLNITVAPTRWPTPPSEGRRRLARRRRKAA